MKRSYPLLLVLIFIVSCNQKNKQEHTIHTVRVTAAKGYLLPADSVAEPKVIFIDKNNGNEQPLKKSTLGKAELVAANTNIHLAGKPTVVIAGTPRICTPGKDTFSLPKLFAIEQAKLKICKAGTPEIVIAKDPYVKDQNPQNFSSFKNLQGLKNSNIRCMLQDRYGNLWFGTYGGGVSKYNGASFTHFTVAEGLCNNTVSSMLEDRQGNLWFGTRNGGVSKYNGETFTNFTEKDGLSNNAVYCMLQDKENNIWLGTYGGGVNKYDGKRFTRFTEKEGLGNKAVSSMLQDSKGNIWFATYGGGVSKYNGKSFAIFTEKEGLAHNTVLGMLEDKDGNFWFGTEEGGVSRYDGKTFTTYTKKEGLSDDHVYCILQDKAGDLWFGTKEGGVSKYNGKTFTHFTEAEGLGNNGVVSLLQDKWGNIWFGTQGGGVSKYNGARFTHFTDKEGLSNSIVKSILQDSAGNLWFGTYGGGANKYDGKTISHFTETAGLGSDIMCMLKDRAGNTWFGVLDGGVCKYSPSAAGGTLTYFTTENGLCNDAVLCMMEDREGNLWFGTEEGVSEFDGKAFTNFTEKEGLSHHVIYSMLQDKKGNFWFGTRDGGVSKYNPLAKTFTHFTEKEGLGVGSIGGILEDRFGNLWFGTNGGGACMYNGNTLPAAQASFTHFTEKEGLSNNGVSRMLEDRYGNIWLGTRNGINKITASGLKTLLDKVASNTLKETDVFFKNYTYEDGFSGIGCGPIYEDKSGTIWFGATDRLTAYHPPLKESADTIAPTIQLTAVGLYNENIAWQSLKSKKDSALTLGNGVSVSNYTFDSLNKYYAVPQNLSLAYNNNYLTFKFIGITMNQPKKVQYQYKLEGLDEDWSALTTRNEAPYGNLDHGNYIFKVKAMNSEGYWSAPIEYAFSIRPPFWLTWWFKTLMVLLLIGSVAFYIKWRERKLKAEKEVLEQTVVERTAEVVQEKKMVEQKNVLVEAQKHLIEEKHREITDSINYAERIQRSFLASKELLDNYLGGAAGYFVLFKPKDVVSGDFYWAAKLNNGHFALVTADSTGHGVPGAIMSLLNITSLEKAIEYHTEPHQILNATRKTIIERLKKDGSEQGGKDGMDASLLAFDFTNKKLLIAAANNPVWIVRGPELIEIKPDKMPVGKHDKDQTPFSLQSFDMQAGDIIYAITDGYPDQFGGEKGKKFMSKNLKELLLNNAQLPMPQQKELLNQTFKNWVGALEQVDDVTVIGVRV